MIISLLLATGIDAATFTRTFPINREKSNPLTINPLFQNSSQDQTTEIIIDAFNLQEVQKRFSQQLISPRTINKRFLVAKIKTRDLEKLSRDKTINKIHQNRQYSMLLEDSIPVTNAPELWTQGYTGKNIKIAILDTGINKDHPMLKNKVITEKALVTDNPTDINGHGSHVAGIAAGKKTTEGFNGIAPDALLMNAKVLDNTGKGTTESIASGIFWATDPDQNPATDDGADIISMSLGAPYTTPDEVINSAIDNAISKGIIVVIASGNCGPGGSSSCKGFVGVTVPGNYEPAITVGAVDNNLQWQAFSSGQDFGSYIKPDIVAPGSSITSSLVNGYGTKSGTSMATPFVAGAAALLLEKDPSLTHQSIKKLFEENALDLGDNGKDAKYGSGFFSLGEKPQPEENTASAKPTEVSYGIEPGEKQPSDVLGSLFLLSSSDASPFETEGCSGDRLCGGKCWKDCSKSDFPHWNCMPDGEVTCCSAGYPYYNPQTNYCTNNPKDYGCSKNYPYICADINKCVKEQLSCEIGELCGNKLSYCADEKDKGVCINEEYYCCDEKTPYYWESDELCHNEPQGSKPTCGDTICSDNEDEWSCPDDCNQPCSSNECTSWYWKQCYDPGETCCSGDNKDNNPLTEFPQYYCNANTQWAACTNNETLNNMNLCEKAGNYYCTNENDLRKLRECALGCENGKCLSNVCGNGMCEKSESVSSCSKDCYSDIRIMDYYNPPSQVIEGEKVNVIVKVKNYGSVKDTSKIEAGIIPKTFFSSDFDTAEQKNIGKCCSNNEYYAAKEVTLNPGQEEDVAFVFYAPKEDSYDHCSPTKKTAWGNTFEFTTSLYDQCCSTGNCKIQDTLQKDVIVIDQCFDDKECVNKKGQGYQCDFSQDPQICVYNKCESECKDYDQYSCTGAGDIQRCTKQNNGCYAYETTAFCYGSSVCEQGKASCQQQSVSAKLIVEDAEQGQTVYKQPGDIVSIKLDYNNKENIELVYDSAIFTGDCPTTTKINSDINCILNIDENAQPGTYSLKLKGSNTEIIKIITNPQTLIITDKKRLYDRFSSDKQGVNNLIKQAYQTANEQYGVVYDIGLYLSEHPFSSFSSYEPEPLLPDKKANKYALVLAEFIDRKCNSCQNVILLGDDYVIPQYRVDYADISFWNYFKTWFSTNQLTNVIYTDQPYIKENKKDIGDLKTLFDTDEYKEVVFVVPNNIDAALSEKITETKNILKDTYGYQGSKIKTYNSDQIDCDSGKLDDGTLILIGTRETNNAIKCVPWFDIGKQVTDSFKASIEIERNVWGGNKYAVVISGSDLSAGVRNFNTLLENPFLLPEPLQEKNTLYIHEMSDPPDLPLSGKELFSHVGGFVLGTCEEGGSAEKVSCSATDLVVSLTPPLDVITDIRDMGIYCIAYGINKVTGEGETFMNGLICGGSTTGTAVTVGKYVTAATVAGAVAGTFADGAITFYKRVLKTAKVLFNENTVKFYKYLDNIEFFSYDKLKMMFKDKSGSISFGKGSKASGFIDDMAKHKLALNKLYKEFSAEEMSKTLSTTDALIITAKGTQEIESSGKLLKSFNKNVNNLYRLELIKRYGEFVDKFIKFKWPRFDSSKENIQMVFVGISDTRLYEKYGLQSVDEIMLYGLDRRGKPMEDIGKHLIGEKIDSDLTAFISTTTKWSTALNYGMGLNDINKPKKNFFIIKIKVRDGGNLIDSKKAAEMYKNKYSLLPKIVEEDNEFITYYGKVFPEDIPEISIVDAKTFEQEVKLNLKTFINDEVK